MRRVWTAKEMGNASSRSQHTPTPCVLFPPRVKRIQSRGSTSAHDGTTYAC
eukprot:m.980094 g.980094  ORF g.980094 m.980094 type:complete len:51 (+) comp23963_c0_seq11:49-201(+)